MDNKFIGISEDRLHHMISVARKCYSLAKAQNYDEAFCRKMFMLGWCHDVGYEFSENQQEHAEISFEMVNSLYEKETNKISDEAMAIRNHGEYSYSKNPDELKEMLNILNRADLLIDNKGNEVDVITRLKDIRNRYGVYSKQYLKACVLAHEVGLTPTNLAGKERQ